MAKEEKIEEQETEEVVHSFLVSSYQRDLRHQLGEMEGEMEEAVASPIEYAQTPNIPDLNHYAGDPLSPATVTGRRLAHLGDEFMASHQNELDAMVNTLLPQIFGQTRRAPGGSKLDVALKEPNVILRETYGAFSRVAQSLFRDGINWGRVVSLLCFGYRLALALCRYGLRHFASSLVALIVRFILGENILSVGRRIITWIMEQGGWIVGVQTETARLAQTSETNLSGRLANYTIMAIMLASAVILLTNFLRTQR